ncbi:glycosyltransferase family 1 protein [Halobacillus amylolyticus]|uniref:Glycosyltransferase family 1 protein n=1 Tax=Halobacillus amylolyticus TaxID=2932259 RepID=A0ABY4HGX2_9BACI|nr:glycosyltransferase family 1 protein [Halobacillus amylolyticus]UOR13801.1 glycosyltransferase family 1 protein [Halobacillus amylolyticus]
MGRPLRVLHVVVNMNRGGAETLIMNLYRNIDRSKVQFDFLTCKEGVFDSEITSMGGVIHRIPYVTDVGHQGYKKALANFFQTNQTYKIVHSHMDKMSGIVLHAAKKARVPVRIAHSHNTRSEGGIASQLYKFLAGSTIRQHATHLYACSNAAAKWLFGGRSDQAFILKNGVDCDRFIYSTEARTKIREQLGLEHNSFVLGHVGRFAQQKNHLFLIDVFAKLTKVHPNTRLILVGDGPLKSQIKEKITELGIESKVKVLGVRKDIHRLLQAYDLFVFPSLHEGLPVTLIEAQNAGLPCIIADTITSEVDMGLNLVRRLSLKEQKLWLNAIQEQISKTPVRTIDRSALHQKGYDIRKTASHAQTSYIDLGGEVS